MKKKFVLIALVYIMLVGYNKTYSELYAQSTNERVSLHIREREIVAQLLESEAEEALDENEVLDNEEILIEDNESNNDNVGDELESTLETPTEEQVVNNSNFQLYPTTKVQDLSAEFLEEFFANNDFIKIGQDGSMLAIQEKHWLADGSEEDGSQWSCALDKTGLLWEIKKAEGIHQKNIKYRWGGKTTVMGRYDSRETGQYFEDWDKLVDESNEEQLCDYSDWRVPTAEELSSLLTEEKSRNLYINLNIFPNSQGWYWTASPYASYTHFASTVYFDLGRNSHNFRKIYNHVRLVRKDIAE